MTIEVGPRKRTFQLVLTCPNDNLVAWNPVMDVLDNVQLKSRYERELRAIESQGRRLVVWSDARAISQVEDALFYAADHARLANLYAHEISRRMTATKRTYVEL